MIIGIGIDLVEIERIEAAIARSGWRFISRLFTDGERRLCAGRPWRFAGRFASKEALLKAVGTGLHGFSWQEIEILAGENGAPKVVCHGRFAAALQEQGVKAVHLTISHSRTYAVAEALLEGAEDS